MLLLWTIITQCAPKINGSPGFKTLPASLPSELCLPPPEIVPTLPRNAAEKCRQVIIAPAALTWEDKSDTIQETTFIRRML